MTSYKPAFHESSEQSLFDELRVQAKAEGISSQGEYRELIQELLEVKVSEGVFDVNEDLTTIEHDLEGRWPEVEAGLR
jgi:hypothetical protein